MTTVEEHEMVHLTDHFESLNFAHRSSIRSSERSVRTFDTNATPTSSELKGLFLPGDVLSESSSKREKKEKKKKDKEKKQKKKQKKKKLKAADRLLEGEFEGELEGGFDSNFVPEAFLDADLPIQWKSSKSIDWGADCFHADSSINFDQTPRTQSTAATMSSRGSKASLENLKSIQPMLGPPMSSCGNSRVSAGEGSKASGGGVSKLSAGSAESKIKDHRDMLQKFLTTSGQDEKLAMATALAFENFLLSQEQYGGTPSASEAGSTRAGDSSDDEEEGGDGIDIDVLHDDSDVSTLGWSCAEGDDETTFGSSWANGTFIGSVAGGSNNGGDFGEVRQNEQFIGRITSMDFAGGGRRVPNRVAAAQGRAVQGALQRTMSGHVFRNSVEERSFEQQMAALSIDERGVVNALKVRWLKSGRPPFPNSWYLRFARSSPGRPFTFKTALKSMKKYDQRYMSLSIATMEQQIRVRMLFPVKGLKSAHGHDMFYMKPARYFPRRMSVASVINNLIYVMDCLTEKEAAQRDGIGFVANMTDWTMANFQTSYCYKFMMALQGKKTPVRVQLFLIVNPPSWFGSIWSIMKPMLSEEFRRKVKMIPFDEMKHYLHPTFQQFLPDDMTGGLNDTNQIIEDFVNERRQIESARLLSASSIH